jgi:two-component system, OmpR family, KDP operon response regulator KdpE
MGEKKILIVDDDQHLVLGLTPRLKANGYRVVSAPDAISAIAVARKEAPDLVILDLGLPAGDGFTVLQRMRNLTELMTTPVIVLTARSPAGNEKRVLDAGATAFFQKPPDNHDFLAAIRQALGETSGLSTFLKT